MRAVRVDKAAAHLESHTRDITDGVTLSAETGDENFVVLLDKVEATVTGDESCDLLAYKQRVSAG